MWLCGQHLDLFLSRRNEQQIFGHLTRLCISPFQPLILYLFNHGSFRRVDRSYGHRSVRRFCRQSSIQHYRAAQVCFRRGRAMYNIKLVTKDLQGLIKNVESSSQSGSIHDVALAFLCTECYNVAARLLEALNKLSVQPETSLWGCFRVALRTVWSKAEVNSLQNKFRCECSCP